MPQVLTTAKAEEDLLEIWSYIAADNIGAADKLLEEVGAACERLAANPGAGRLREELAPALRSVPVGNYVIFYRPVEEGIVVIRVLHGARDIPSLF
ncbi:MAG: type II toxin-antitoxin system RelE/ParE family toxin [Planctomycetota bacterium]|nr:type II toxin-antitoxin system RelE/ParE family toxin [Planctomycetota bacterium]